MNRPTGPPLRDRFPELIYAYIGPNGAHLDFRVAMANAKALAYVLGRGDAAVLQGFLREADEARKRSGDGHFALGMAGGRSTMTSVQLAVHLTGNEIALIEAEPGGFASQAFGLVYREVYRVFETFLVDLFAEIAVKDKRVLYSSQTLTHKEALKADTPEALQQLILDHRKADLTRGGFAHLERTFDRIGLPLIGPAPLNDEQQNARDRLVFLSAARNIIEHNRSVVNDEFLALVPSAPYHKGQKVLITATELGDALSAAEWVVDALNRRAVGKFGLPD
jgi:hypothetical protein